MFKRTNNSIHTKRELVTQTYWGVSYQVRHIDSPRTLTCGKAITMTLEGEKLPPEEWRLKNLLHILKYDIIEGKTEWRKTGNENEVREIAEVFQLIPYMTQSTSMVRA